MKKATLILATFIMCLSTSVYAQTGNGIVANVKGTHLSPKTTIIVDVLVRKESVTTGPYARYSQQMLGVVAPLNDKTEYAIEAIQIRSVDSGNLVNSNGENIGSRDVKSGFMKCNLLYGTKSVKFMDMGVDPVLTPDAGVEKSVKVMASDASDAIFKLRRRRFDLVTGELGENVYGEGMKSALKEIDRLEKEYISLFMGKHQIEYATYRYEIEPDAQNGDYSFTLAHFDNKSGILDSNNIAGKAVVLSVKKENRVVVDNQGSSSKKGGNTESYMVPDLAKCSVKVGDETFVKKNLYILQFGSVGTK